MANRRRRSTVLMLMLAMMLVMVMAKAAVEFLGEEEEDEEEEDYNGDGVVVTQADYTALRAFKHALDDPRGVLRSWNESAVGGACNGGWVGIKCVRGQVISIQIPWRGLRGHIAEQVGQLTQLRKLNLHDNLLQGPVPRSLSFLNHLRGLYLFRNLLSGTIPPGLGASSKYFQSVDLSHNLLSGAIPTGLASSPNIYRINLSSNNFTGSLPSDISASPSLRFLDLSRNTLSGPLRWSIITALNHTPSFEMLSLNLSYNRFTGLVPVSLAELKNLRELSLAHNNLSGSIPAQLSNITALQALDLSGNSLTGRIPESLGELITLTQFNVSDNDLSGSVPSNLSRRFASGSFAGNPHLCGYSNTTQCSVALPSPSPSPQAPPSAHKKRKKTLTWILIILGSIVGFLLILCSLVLLCCFCRRSSKEQTAKRGTERGAAAGAQGGGGVTEAGEVGGKLVHFDGPLVFTADDLLCATAEVMGKSSYGTMYKATLEDGNQVAVKRLRERIAKGQRDFESEANALGKIRHSNLLALRAYYWGPKDEKLLVFDFMPGGSLAAFLHARAPETPLDWITRMKISLGAARGLAYLHSHENMVHGNLTSSNILLDSDMNAKIADFGLSRLMTPAANSNVIATAGALGYRAPELTKLKKATSKTDVYSYGIVLLELLTGKAPGEPTNMDNAGGNGLDLPEWVASIVKEEWTHEVFDLELMKDATSNAADELLNTLQLAMHCVDPTPSSRPDMDEVVHQLQQIKPELAPPSPASS